HRLTEVTDPRGKTAQYAHSGGRLARFTDPTGKTTGYAYSGDGSTAQTKITDATGAQTTLAFDPDGNIKVVIDPQNRRTSYAWADHRLTTYTTARGYRTTFTYATFGNRTSGLRSIIDARTGR